MFASPHDEIHLEIIVEAIQKREWPRLYYPNFNVTDFGSIVRRIFAMRAQELGYRRIAVLLNEEKTPTPRDYYYQQIGKANPRNTYHVWSDVTVREILKNEAYIGSVA